MTMFFLFLVLNDHSLIPDFHDRVGQGSDPLDLDIHPVAWHHRADPCRCACGDDIARIQGHDVGDEPYQKGYGKNQVPRAARLLQLAVEESFEPQPRRIDFCGDARADAGERIEGFGPGELHIFGLEIAGGHIVETGVAQDMILGGVVRAEAGCFFLDDHCQFSLEIHPLGHGRINDDVVGPHHSR